MTLQKYLSVIAISLPLSFMCLDTSAKEFYKWVDEHGTTHYGKKPPKGVDTQSVKTHTGRSEPTSYESKKEAPEKTAAAAEQKAQKSAQACNSARKNLETINSNARIKVKQDNGEFRYLSPDEINQRKQQANDIIRDNC